MVNGYSSITFGSETTGIIFSRSAREKKLQPERSAVPEKKEANLATWIELPQVEDDAKLSFAESGKHIPFQIQRIYYILDCKPGLDRGHHAHRETQQAFFCLRGSLDMYLDDGEGSQLVHLDSPNKGLFLPSGLWHEMRSIQEDAVMLVLASKPFDEQDYIRDHQEFLSWRGIVA